MTVVSMAGVLSFLYYVVSCNEVHFQAGLSYNCTDDTDVEGVSCLSPQDIIDIYNVPADTITRVPTRITTRLGRADILFVVDDSESMREEQESIADQFDQFLSAIAETDYQIAIITTNLEKDKGQFIEFPNGKIILSNSSGNGAIHNDNVDHFRATIRRPIDPQEHNDERGIAALNMALDKSAHSVFFRPHSLLVVIIISDEDERSFGGRTYGFVPPDQRELLIRPLEAIDRPATFFQRVNTKNRYSSVIVHSIIVKPGDERCRSEANGVEGHVYAEASKPDATLKGLYGNLKDGYIASICDRNYGDQLRPIAELTVEVVPIHLPCFPEPASIRLRVDDDDDIGYDLKGREIHITEDVHYGAEADVIFYCKEHL